MNDSELRIRALDAARMFSYINHHHMLQTAREIERYLQTGWIPSDDFQENTRTNNEESHNNINENEE